MSTGKNKIKLVDLIDIDFLQEFQDFFAKTMELASITVDENGPITKPSNFTDFCSKYTRGSKEGYKRCNACDIQWGKVAAKTGEPVIYDCHTGLRDFAVPIVVAGEHIASILGGQVLTKEPNEENFRQIARELKINEDDYIKQLRKIKIVSPERVEAAANFLYLIANAISKISYKKLQLIQKSEREQALREIISIIGSAMDQEEIKKEIVSRIGIYLGADRVLWGDFNPKTEKYTVSERGEYKSSSKLKSLCDFDFMSIPGFIENISNRHRQGEDIILTDPDDYIKEKGPSAEALCSFFKKQGFMTFMALNINYGKLYFGTMVVAFANKKDISDDEIDFVKTIAKQAGFAVNQFRLYEAQAKQVKREKLLVSIISHVRSSLEIEEILSFICEESAKLFDVQRVAVIAFPDPKNYLNFVIKKEYVVSQKIKTYPNSEEAAKTAAYWREELIKKNDILAFDNIAKSITPDYFKNTYNSLGVKSSMGTAIKKGNDVWGTLVLSDYNNANREWEEEEQLLLKSISDQLYIAINQAELYEKEKKNAQREKLIRKIIETIRSSLDLKVVKQNIIEELGKEFNADRCYFRLYDKKHQKFLAPDVEYLSSVEIPSLLKVEPNQEELKFFAEEVKRQKKGFYPIVVDKDFAKGTPLEKYMEASHIVADYAIPIIDRYDELSWLVLHYSTKDPKLSGEDKKFLETIAYQIDIAFEQIQLYEKAQKNAQREALLRNMVETIRSNIDIEKTKQVIIQTIGKALNADRCFIMEFDKQNDRFIEHKEEYSSSANLKSCAGMDLNHDLPNLVGKFKKGKSLIYNQPICNIDGEKIDLNNELFEAERQVVEEYKIYSGVVFPIFHADDFFGDLVLNYADKEHEVGQDEITLLQTVSGQLAIALYQAKLFEQMKIQNEIQNAILNNMPSLAWLKDKNSIILAANEAFAQNCNVKIEDLIGKSDFDFFPEEHAKSYVKEDQIVMETRQTVSSNDLVNGADGVSRWHETFKSPVVDYKGNIVGTVGLSRDITDMKNAITELLNKQKQIIKAKEQESLLRNIFEVIRSSLDLDETLSFICESIAKAFNVQRVAVVCTPDHEHLEKYIVKKEYKASPLVKGIEHVGDFGNTAIIWTKNFLTDTNVIAFDNIETANVPETFKIIYRELGVKSAIGAPIRTEDTTWGGLVLSEYNRYRHWSENEKELLKIISNQIYIAINQAELYERQKDAAKKESTLRKTMEVIRRTLETEKIKQKFVDIACVYFNADRCLFVDYNKETDKFLPFGFEMLRTEGVQSLLYHSVEDDFPEFAKKLKEKKRNIIIKDLEKTLARKHLPNYKAVESLHKSDAKSDYGLLVQYQNEIFGILILHYVKAKRVLNHEELDFLKILIVQVGIALHQADLYEKEKQLAEREKILRLIMLSSISNFNFEEIIHTIVSKTGEVFNADRCFYVEYDYSTDSHLPIKDYAQYLSSDSIRSHLTSQPNKEATDLFIKQMKEKKVTTVDNIYEIDLSDSAKKMLINDLSVKSYLISPIFYRDVFYGSIVLHYVNDYKYFNEADIEFAKAIAYQAAVVIKQAELYEKEKLAAERERISRNIIEILRSSIDKIIIKKLFVKNIGKFFNADRVFISEYDAKTKTFLPVDKDSEYLSNISEKSFIGFDWSTPETSICVQPLSEKREIRIPNWPEFIEQTPDIQENFLKMYEQTQNKSSYAFPVMYQDKLLGFFCIEFTQNVTILSNDDIGRIRSICSQAGIALYHADLYSIAQQCDFSKEAFKADIAKKVELPVNNILETSMLLLNNEYERPEEINYLQEIINSCNKLFELTKDISDN